MVGAEVVEPQITAGVLYELGAGQEQSQSRDCDQGFGGCGCECGCGRRVGERVHEYKACHERNSGDHSQDPSGGQAQIRRHESGCDNRNHREGR